MCYLIFHLLVSSDHSIFGDFPDWIVVDGETLAPVDRRDTVHALLNGHAGGTQRVSSHVVLASVFTEPHLHTVLENVYYVAFLVTTAESTIEEHLRREGHVLESSRLLGNVDAVSQG
jgi:hypothetical protein